MAHTAGTVRRLLFSSFPYILLFLPAAAGVHAVIRLRAGWPWPQVWLLAASLFFYAYAKPSSVPVLLGSILFNWGIARLMGAQIDLNRRKLFLWIGLIVNIAVLFLFKYVNLLLSTIAFFHGPQLKAPNWGFPLGVSFFTLTQIMYLVDAFPRPPTSAAGLKIFRGLPRPNSLFDHATFVSLFPYVISGPLVHARSIVPQLREFTMPDSRVESICRGLYMFSLGLAKKVVLADSFAPIADAGFASARDFSSIEAWAFCFAALLHLYFDFSGYSDMAVGTAWMLGIDIPNNFNAPLRARSITEFWQRWHISLTNFITDYLYKPLLRSMGRPTLRSSAVAILLAMTIAGLWHGPAWTFAAWGICHGIALAAHQVWKSRKLSMPGWLGWLLTLLFVTATIVFLRSANLRDALHMLSRLIPHGNAFGFSAVADVLPFTPLLIFRPVAIGVIVALFFKSSMQYARDFQPSFRTAVAVAFLVLISLFFINSAPARQFVYFAF
jgi:alginate O-acetyltransferase complex protein AlgI